MGIVGIVVWFGALAAAFFFLVVRPQRRQAIAHAAMVAGLQVGDEIVTSGGIHGTVRGVSEEAFEVEIADGVQIKLARGAVAHRAAPLTADDTANGEAV